jgi:hypothetical protein
LAAAGGSLYLPKLPIVPVSAQIGTKKDSHTQTRGKRSMKIGISVRIDVTKIEKERLYKGAKGTYLDLTTFIDTDTEDQYGNHGFISQSVDKDERAAGVKTPILGNCKVFYKDATSNTERAEQYNKGAEQARAATAPDHSDFADDDIPF